MEKIYAKLIKKNIKTIEDVPLKLKEKVIALLENNEVFYGH